ncbi:MAG: hypothetical protein EBX50_21845, partial [Chitinophagia bacterium]|nr:hypothetical protein [Chitinophagia bacterium]
MQNHFIYVLVFTGLLSCQPSSSENNPIPLEGKSIFRVDLTSKKKTENALEQNQSKEKLSNQAQTCFSLACCGVSPLHGARGGVNPPN